MSRTSLKQKRTTPDKATASVSRARRRPVVVFDSASNYTVKDTVWLYAVVFKSRSAMLLALIFCVCFLSQPFQSAYAQVPDAEPTVTPEIVPEPTVIIEEVTPIELNPEPSPVTSDLSQSESDQTVEDSTTEPVLPVDTSNNEQSDIDEVVPTIEYTYEEPLTAASSSDSETQFQANLNVVAVVDSDSAFSFSKDECTRIEDGSFYCNERQQNELRDNTLVAAPDSDGDLEIFLHRDGVQIQITKNTEDDASPYYDEKSKTIVWHRLINDRYQIISFDPETGKELQFTSGNVNNMEPTRQGDYITWQRWVDDNWEIVLYDGQQELQITDSSEHDTAPHIHGSLIIWNSQALDGEQMLKTYDIENRSFTNIADGEGVSVSNPRMIVMYEALYENGDVVMKGFDLATGEIVPLHALPRELPDQIPNTDSTGETRALIQGKPSVRDDLIRDADGIEPVIIPPLPPSDPFTLDLGAIATTSDIEISQPDPVIPDLIIPPPAVE